MKRHMNAAVLFLACNTAFAQGNPDFDEATLARSVTNATYADSSSQLSTLIVDLIAAEALEASTLDRYNDADYLTAQQAAEVGQWIAWGGDGIGYGHGDRVSATSLIGQGVSLHRTRQDANGNPNHADHYYDIGQYPTATLLYVGDNLYNGNGWDGAEDYYYNGGVKATDGMMDVAWAFYCFAEANDLMDQYAGGGGPPMP